MVNSVANYSPYCECSNCGQRGKFVITWQEGREVKELPRGWSQIPNTFGGTVFFCTPEHEQVWTSTRPFGYMPPPPPEIVEQVKEEIAVIAETELLHGQTMCECGLGPFEKKAVHLHMRGRIHRDRMAYVT